MRVGPFEFSWRASAAAEPTVARLAKEQGASGTILQDGWLSVDEYNRDVRWPRSITTYERMRRSDASVREALQHIVSPILNATWAVDAASDDPLDLEVAEFVRRSYFDWPVEPFEQTLRQTLNFLIFGHQVFELVEQVVDAELTWDDPTTGEPVTAPARQFVTWRRWAYRKPDTIARWFVQDGELTAIRQSVMKGSALEEPTIPAEQLVVFVNEKEGDDFTGMSLLRSAYKAWVEKEVVEKVMGVAIERHGVGVPTAYVPESVRNDDAQMDRVEEMLKGIRSGQFTYMLFPGPKGEASAGAGTGGYLFEIVTPPGGIPDFSGPLEYLRGEIKGNVLARFSELGHGSTGARATGDVQSEVWYSALHSVATYAQSVHRAAIKRLVDKNYRVTAYPTLVARDIETRNLTEFADAVSKLTSSGALLADDAARRATRTAIDFPDEDDAGEAAQPTDPSQPDKPIEEDPTNQGGA